MALVSVEIRSDFMLSGLQRILPMAALAAARVGRFVLVTLTFSSFSENEAKNRLFLVALFVGMLCVRKLLFKILYLYGYR